jgi:peptidoglycan hydrolase CwlO-like protein
MASFGKKVLGAFVETEVKAERRVEAAAVATATVEDRFAEHFDKLLSEANIPGPDYYEFARMTAAMRGIPDEAARFNAAFAGLQVQGLDKQRLLDTAAEYLRVLTADAQQFQTTVDASYQEKVKGKESEAEGMAARIKSLSQEMMQLQQRIGVLQDEIRASKEKLAGGSSAYNAESKRRQQEIQRDVEKINRYIH